MADIVYLNGDFIEKSQAKISVLDRGFLFGDGIYEVIPVYHSSPFQLEQHLQRLFDNAKNIQIDVSLIKIDWSDIIEDVISKNGGGNLLLYIQLTRGVAKERNHTFPENTSPTVLIMCSPLAIEIAEMDPIKVTLLEDIRWQYCHIKSTSLLGGILLNQQAKAAGFQEAILYRNKQVTEGSASNVFAVKNGVIYTPEKAQCILGGITRDLIIELALKNDTFLVECPLSLEDLTIADEVWISSSSREISPVTNIDDKIVGNGQVGDLTKKMHHIFQSFKNTLTTKIN